MSLRVLIVDDEPAARAGLSAMLRRYPQCTEIRECGDRDTAVRMIRNDAPQLVFLDIQLSPGTGFDVIARVGAEAMPPVVFITAFDSFALAAFKVAAVDYLVKPVAPEQIGAALERAMARMRQETVGEMSARLTGLAAAIARSRPTSIVVTDGSKTHLFEEDEISMITAADYYADIRARDRSFLVRETLDALESRLPSPPFVRVHRSAIVNARFVAGVVRVTRHRYEVSMRDGSRAPASAAGRVTLLAVLASDQVAVQN